MMTKTEVKDWLDSLPDDSDIAIDDGGLALVEVRDGKETGAYCEVGGTPEDTEDD